MKRKIITAKMIAEFREHLILEERSTVTVEKYIRDVKAFSVYTQNSIITKETVIAYKKHLQENYAVRSVNSMLASINSLFAFLGWHDLRVKSLKLQQQVFCPEEKELTKAQLKQKVDIIEQQTQAQKTIIESQALAQKRAQEGYTYAQERGFNVAEKVAENEAVGEFTNMGVGLGTMAGVGGAVGGMVGGMMNDAVSSASTGSVGSGLSMDAFKEKIEKLKLMKEAGMMSDEEFDAARKALLNNI